MFVAAGYGFILAALIVSCNNAADKKNTHIESDSLAEEQRHLPENALKTLTVADGLEVTAIATEPMLQNPTNIECWKY